MIPSVRSSQAVDCVRPQQTKLNTVAKRKCTKLRDMEEKDRVPARAGNASRRTAEASSGVPGVPQERRTHPLTSERFPWGSARRHVTAVCAGGGATSLQDRPLLCRGLRSALAERTPSLASRCHLPQRGPGSAGSWWPRHGRARSTLSLRPARSSVVAL